MLIASESQMRYTGLPQQIYWRSYLFLPWGKINSRWDIRYLDQHQSVVWGEKEKHLILCLPLGNTVLIRNEKVSAAELFRAFHTLICLELSTGAKVCSTLQLLLMVGPLLSRNIHQGHSMGIFEGLRNAPHTVQPYLHGASHVLLIGTVKKGLLLFPLRRWRVRFRLLSNRGWFQDSAAGHLPQACIPSYCVTPLLFWISLVNQIDQPIQLHKGIWR